MSQIAIVGRYEEPIVPPKTERPSILKAAPNKFTEMARKSGDLLDDVIRQFNKESSEMNKSRVMDIVMEETKIEETLVEQSTFMTSARKE